MRSEYQRQTATIEGLIERQIKGTEIIDYGTITNIVEEDKKVIVELLDKKKIPCLLFYPANKAITIKYKVSVGDRVLVLFSREFSFDMLQNKEDIKGAILNYNILGGICFPIGNSDTNDNTNISIDDKGSIEIKNPHTIAKIDTTGDVSVVNDKTTLQLNNDGTMSLNANGAKIEIDSSGNITLNATGKISIKNNVGNLKSLLDNLISKAEKLTEDSFNGAKACGVAIQALSGVDPTTVIAPIFEADKVALETEKAKIPTLLE